MATPVLARQMPATLGREEEEGLLRLCARGLDVAEWLAFGPRYFMSGVAMLLAQKQRSDDGRRACTLLAEALFPGSSTVEEFRRWLAQSPVTPSRFYPMLEQEKRLNGVAGAQSQGLGQT